MRQWRTLGYSDDISAPNPRPLSVSHHQVGFGILSMLMVGLAGCVGNQPGDGVLASPTAPIQLQSKTESSAGHFLAARQALYFNDIDQSANFFLETLRDNSDNADLLRQTFMTQYYQGNITKAAALGRPVSYTHLTLPTICSV